MRRRLHAPAAPAGLARDQHEDGNACSRASHFMSAQNGCSTSRATNTASTILATTCQYTVLNRPPVASPLVFTPRWSAAVLWTLCALCDKTTPQCAAPASSTLSTCTCMTTRNFNHPSNRQHPSLAQAPTTPMPTACVSCYSLQHTIALTLTLTLTLALALALVLIFDLASLAPLALVLSTLTLLITRSRRVCRCPSSS